MKYLITGLGNIGAEYEHTRHNIGFDVADKLAKDLDVKFDVSRLAAHAKASFKGKQIHIIKPATYMNLSGRAVKYWMNELKIPVENILIIADEVALPFGTLRLRGKGSSAGHNGLNNIEEELQTREYARLRFGIGNDFPKGHQVDYVLGKWNKEQESLLQPRIDLAVEIARSFCTIGLDNTMSSFNNK